MKFNGIFSCSLSEITAHPVARCCAIAALLSSAAFATEGGGSVYPEGAETVLPGAYPAPGGSLFAEFNDFYVANELAGPNGRAVMPGFHLRVSAAAVKVAHNWGVHVLGGTFLSMGALPMVDIHLTAPIGQQNKIGMGNGDIENVIVYKTGDVHWWYGYEIYPPGFAYTKNALVNIGQHNWASGPSAAFSWLPNGGRAELSSKLQYMINGKDDATDYHSGNEFVWEYDGLVQLSKRLAVGADGYYYQQTTDDTEGGLVYLDGNRGRNVAFGPEIRCHVGHYVLALKWQKDFLTENRPMGNAVWFQFGVPFGHAHE